MIVKLFDGSSILKRFIILQTVRHFANSVQDCPTSAQPGVRGGGTDRSVEENSEQPTSQGMG